MLLMPVVTTDKKATSRQKRPSMSATRVRLTRRSRHSRTVPLPLSQTQDTPAGAIDNGTTITLWSGHLESLLGIVLAAACDKYTAGSPSIDLVERAHIQSAHSYWYHTSKASLSSHLEHLYSTISLIDYLWR